MTILNMYRIQSMHAGETGQPQGPSVGPSESVRSDFEGAKCRLLLLTGSSPAAIILNTDGFYQ